MKTKLTLNIDDRIIEKAKIISKKRKQSISSIVEEYLDKITLENQKKIKVKETFTENFRKLFPANPVKEDYNYKKVINEYRDKKYGSK
jgi:chorismate mutase